MSDTEFRAVLDELGRRAPVHSDAAKSPQRIAVLGAGSIGQLLACEALAAGLDVRMHSASGHDLQTLKDAQAISVRGAHLSGNYKVTVEDGAAAKRNSSPSIALTASVDTAIEGAEIIFVATPAAAHPTYAGLLAESLRDGQTLVLVPGRFLGAVELANTLASHLCTADVTIAELETAPYVASRSAGHIKVLALAREVKTSSFPIGRASGTVARLETMLSMLVPVDSPLETAFGGVTGVLCVAPLIMNTSMVESTPRQMVLFKELIPIGLATTVLADLDEERREVAFHFGVRDLPSAANWLRRTFDLDFIADVDDADNLATAVAELELFDDYGAINEGGPRVIDDVPNMLVPLASAGRVAGVATPITDAIIVLAGSLAASNFSREGRTLENLGLSGVKPADMRRQLVSLAQDHVASTMWRTV